MYPKIKKMINNLELPGCSKDTIKNRVNAVENFYKKFGFKKHKTAYAKYPFESKYLED
ncbi:hypothetical protein [Clostridium sp. DL-VIII]|uniref:hypothetical protein n=1 Tax=Clostridium sp. DL-VIII TaxID=641107 RepID=UPI00031BF487|nr:hypothetical protein [Clostridium sp. DL-VIII]